MPFLTNTRKKCVIREINLFLVSFLAKIFPSKVCHFQYNDRLLFSTEIGNIRTWKEMRLQKLEIYIVKIAFVLAFFKLLKN